MWPTPAGKMLFFTLIALAVAAVVAFVGPADAEGHVEDGGAQNAISEASDKIQRIMLHFARNTPRHPVHREGYRKKFSDRIAAAAVANELEIGLVTAVVSKESSFRINVIPGPAGEIGVMQVHPRTAKWFGCDMSTVSGQLDCGCRVLRFGINKCGTVEGALTVYGSNKGACTSKRGSRLWRAVKRRMELMEEHSEM
jgi:hypothetical protein